jgi:ABC-2 type transport system permease protein
VILIYILLTQYATWLLMGVVEEKSSRVIEVLLATLRPLQLLAGKVVGIGATAFLQSALILAAALIAAAASGSDLLHGSTPLDVVVILAWLVLAYGFYCWIWAAGGSLVERQSQVQSLAFPLQLPVIFGYIVSLVALSSGSASILVKVLAYLPPTAPFAMPTLVALGQASWWQELIAVGITILGTAGVIRLSSYVYYRAILQTGGRVRLAQIFSRRSATLTPATD